MLSANLSSVFDQYYTLGRYCKFVSGINVSSLDNVFCIKYSRIIMISLWRSLICMFYQLTVFCCASLSSGTNNHNFTYRSSHGRLFLRVVRCTRFRWTSRFTPAWFPSGIVSMTTTLRVGAVCLTAAPFRRPWVGPGPLRVGPSPPASPPRRRPLGL